MATPLRKNPCSGNLESYYSGRPFLGYNYYIYSLSDICMGVKKKIFKEIMYFHYMTYMTKPEHKNPGPGVTNFRILVDPSLVIITIYLVCLIYKKIFKEIMYFYYVATP